jgi:hypothetical protein
MSWNKQWIVLGLVVVVGLTPVETVWAGVGPFSNGDFETCDLTGWISAGDAGADGEFNVISGSCSAFITTAGSRVEGRPFSGSSAVGDMCSFLVSGLIYPTVTPQAVQVSFKVRYKTDEGIGPYAIEDPFSAELITGLGTVDLLTIKADGVTPGPGTTVINTATGLPLPPPPTVPPAVAGTLYRMETPTLVVSSRIPYGSCDLVAVKFSICDFLDSSKDSAAFLDDVVITIVSPTGRDIAEPCPPPTSLNFLRWSRDKR